MIRKSLDKILRLGFLTLIVLIFFFLSGRNAEACTSAAPLTCQGGPTYSCGFYRGDPDGWVCGIKMTPDSYYCKYTSDANDDPACSSADAMFTQSMCPNISSYNGDDCVFADGSQEWWGAVHCWAKYGKWNAQDQACVQCQTGTYSKLRSRLLADSAGRRCYNLTDETWEEFACATEDVGLCDYGCGADRECDGKDYECYGPGRQPQACPVVGGECLHCVFYSSGVACSPDGCNQNCPEGCDVNDDPDCGCVDDNGCCGIGCNISNDNDCSVLRCVCSPINPTCPGGLVPCGRTCDDPGTEINECCPCTLCHFFVLAKRIVDFITINIVFPLAVLIFVIGGIMFMIAYTGGAEPALFSQAKRLVTAAVVGLIVIFTAWLIVNTIVVFLTPAHSILQDWYTIDCPVS